MDIDLQRVRIRYGKERDAEALNNLYNPYVLNTPVTFETEPWTVEQRLAWLSWFPETGPYRLLVADHEGEVLGFANSHRYNERAAYSTTIETSIYLSHEATGLGIGTRLYAALFEALKDEPLHRALAGATLPNDASVALHRRFGFELVGVMHAVGFKLGRYWDVAWFEKPLE